MRLGLIPKLIIGLVIGILLGLYAPDGIIRLTETGRVLLGNLIKFVIPLIIIFFVGAGIAELGKKAGRMLTYTVGLSYVSTVVACLLGAIVAYLVIPSFAIQLSQAGAAQEIGAPFVVIEMPQIIPVISAMLLAFILGIGMTWLKTDGLRRIMLEGREITARVIRGLIIPLVPVFVGCIFSGIAAKGQLFEAMAVFVKMLLIIIVLQVLWLIIQYAAASAYSGQNAFVGLIRMIPAYLTAMGTMSSAATMPVSLSCAKRFPYMRHEVADFVMPLCSTVHLSGAAMTITISAITVNLLTTGAVPPVGTIITFILLLGVIEVGAVGVPGGSALAALGILQSTLGFGEVELGLMLTLFMIQDSFGTATNITGDGAIATIINRLFDREVSDGEDAPAASA